MSVSPDPDSDHMLPGGNSVCWCVFGAVPSKNQMAPKPGAFTLYKQQNQNLQTVGMGDDANVELAILVWLLNVTCNLYNIYTWLKIQFVCEYIILVREKQMCM